MNNQERERLKDEMRAFVAGQADGIGIASEYRWVLTGANSPESFFKNLHLILDSDAVLYFEGCSIASDVSEFYESHKAPNPIAVARDTIFPVPQIFHVSFTPEAVARLCEFVANRPSDELFEHVKAYKGNSLLLAFHDAFSNECVLSGRLAESSVASFATSIGATHRRELNPNKRDKEQLRPLLDALEKPNTLRISGESSWRRFWQRLGW